MVVAGKLAGALSCYVAVLADGRVVADRALSPFAAGCLHCRYTIPMRSGPCRSPGQPLMELGSHRHWVWRALYNPMHDALVASCSSDCAVHLHYTPHLAASAGAPGAGAAPGTAGAAVPGQGSTAAGQRAPGALDSAAGQAAAPAAGKATSRCVPSVEQVTGLSGMVGSLSGMVKYNHHGINTACRNTGIGRVESDGVKSLYCGMVCALRRLLRPRRQLRHEQSVTRADNTDRSCRYSGQSPTCALFRASDSGVCG